MLLYLFIFSLDGMSKVMVQLRVKRL